MPTSIPLHVAGIGASAGGLEAMLSMFTGMHPFGRVTYVVAQHMAKNGHDELVARLIGRESPLPVVLAKPGESLCPDTVYVIPSGWDGAVRGNSLELQEPVAGNPSTPSVNVLLTSIAESHRDNAIGIVLSGTGYDGVLGCLAVKARGGLTIAQDPDEAKFGGMPSAAIDAQSIDEVLPVADIGPALAKRFPGAAAAPAKDEPTTPPGEVGRDIGSRELAHLLPLVYEATGIDFSSYKEDTLLRRLEKRRGVLGIASPDEYLALVKRHPEELKTLQHLFLVSLSSFFRDHDSFRELERALAVRIAEKADGEPIRVWVPGCASGEEPYSLAIVLDGLLGDRRHPLHIVGTDLNGEALEMARAGVYRETAFEEMDEALRARHFTQKGQHYEIDPHLRRSVEFEQRDVLIGAPEEHDGKLDLVSCRNLMIYMKSHLQDRLIAGFHRALAPRGLLFIGQSESLSPAVNSLFAPLDRHHRLFRRR